MYHNFERIGAFFLFLFLLPFLGLCYVIVKFDSPGPFLFVQKRAGRRKKTFFLYKIRTMVLGAESLQKNLKRRNETDGPVFKIRNDPRYTRIGKFLSHTGLDEIPQLINIIRGEMAFVGPRPLPVYEAKQISGVFVKRFEILPGMTSPWIVKGAHRLSFSEWMRLDCLYVDQKSPLFDLVILIRTLFVMGKMIGEALQKQR